MYMMLMICVCMSIKYMCVMYVCADDMCMGVKYMCMMYIHDTDGLCVCVYVQKSEKGFRCPISLSDMFF